MTFNNRIRYYNGVLNLEGRRMQTALENNVVEYQKSENDDIFVEIYSALIPTKRLILRKLRKSLPATILQDEIEAIYDDAVLSCVEKFSPEKGCGFVTFLTRETEDRRKMYLRYLNAEKRKSDAEAMAIDAKASADSETSIGELLADTAAVNAEDNLNCEVILDSLKNFMKTNARNHVNGSLIAFDAVYFETREEKHAAMRQLLGSDISTSGIHKKIKRAKEAFKKYLEENS